MDPLEAAIAALESLKLGEKINYTQIAKKYGVDRTTLSRRHRGGQAPPSVKHENQRLLNDLQETELVKYIDRLTVRGLPPTRNMIRNFASQIAGKEAGKSWVERFLKRGTTAVVSHWAAGIDSSRKKADSALKYSLYFQLLEEKITKYNVEPRHTYNMDEKGFLIGILSKQKRVFSRRRYEEGEIKQMIQDGNREWITTIACICADGTALTPALIYQAVSGKLQDSWLQDFDPELHKTFFTSSASGWTNNELGLMWLRQVFDRETKEKARRSYRLLILDGHGSHLTMDFIEFCDQNRILLAIYPPHSTHTLQPLDVCMFKPLSSAYSTELSNFMYRCQGLSSITKRDFFRLFYAAWHTAFKEKAILKAFECCGIAPFNPEVVLKRFNLPAEERPSSSDSTTSVLSSSDWQKIKRLLHDVVNDIYQKGTKLLSQTIHTMAIQNNLLQHEKTHLKEALINEKKRRQPGKPLLLEAPEEYHGGAVFWSPSKVTVARERQKEKDEAEKSIQAEKDENKKLRAEAKAEKARMLEERKLMRQAAKEIQLQETRKKQAAKEEAKYARQAALQLRKDIQSSKKGKKPKRQNTKPTMPKMVEGEEEEEGEEDQSRASISAPTPARSQRSRPIKLPKRFLD
jgi:hypothetical protein